MLASLSFALIYCTIVPLMLVPLRNNLLKKKEKIVLLEFAVVLTRNVFSAKSAFGASLNALMSDGVLEYETEMTHCFFNLF